MKENNALDDGDDVGDDDDVKSSWNSHRLE